MKIDRLTYAGNLYKSQNPSFSALYASRYFIKCADGQFRQVSNPDTIQSLQGKMIRWLNKSMHESRRAVEGRVYKTKRTESAADKTMRERLIKFFTANDRDYQARRAAKSVYITPIEGGKTTPYILTGKTVDMAGDGKSIGDAHRKIRESRNFIQTYYGVSKEQADKYLSKSDVRRLSEAKADYHRQSEECVRNLMKDDNVDKSVVNFYFEPVLGQRSGKLQKYNLVNAIFQKYMIGPKV